MRRTVKVEDSLRLRSKDKGEIRDFNLDVGVVIQDGKDKEMIFYQGGYCMGNFIHIPLSSWAKVKDMVDRTIIRAEEIWKERKI